MDRREDVDLAARRRVRSPLRTPTMAATIRNTISCEIGNENVMPWLANLVVMIQANTTPTMTPSKPPIVDVMTLS